MPPPPLPAALDERRLALRPFDVSIRHLVLAGWSGRDSAAVEAHIRELAALGTPRPTHAPVFYRVAHTLITTNDVIEVLGDQTSGEVEFVLVMIAGERWVGLGSDHTDRGMETTSVAHAKQLCAKPVAPFLWRYSDVAAHWDRLVLRSWAHRGGTRHLYQEGPVATLLTPERIIALYQTSDTFGDGAALFGGTIPAIGGVSPADSFEIELHDPVLDRRLHHRYEIRTVPVES